MHKFEAWSFEILFQFVKEIQVVCEGFITPGCLGTSAQVFRNHRVKLAHKYSATQDCQAFLFVFDMSRLCDFVHSDDDDERW